MTSLTMSVREAVAQLGIGRNRAYELAARGELPHLRIGTTIRIPTDALTDWVGARTEGTTR